MDENDQYMPKTHRGQSSDVPVFDTFYRDHYDRTYRSLSLATRNVDLARLAADEAMTRAFERWDKIGSYDAPEQWVFRVGLNWAISQIRKRRYETLSILVEPWAEDGLPDPEVGQALAKLPIKLRTVVVARLYLDWSTEATSAALGVPQGTVKSRLSRALIRLERSLETR